MSLHEIIPNRGPLVVSPLLIKLGIPLSLSGHRYICTAVNIYHSMMQTNSRIKITQDIYPEVAHQYGTTSQCVEKVYKTRRRNLLYKRGLEAHRQNVRLYNKRSQGQAD